VKKLELSTTELAQFMATYSGIAMPFTDSPALSVYRTTPLSMFTFIARSSSDRKMPDTYSIVRA